MLVGRERCKESRRENSQAIRSSRQADVSKPAARRGIRKGGIHPLSDQAARRTSASRQRGKGNGRGELTSCRIKSPGGRQQAGSAARNSEGVNSPTVGSSREADVSRPAARRGIREEEPTFCRIKPPDGRQQAGSAARDPGGGSSRPVGSSRQADISKRAVRRIRKGGTHTLSGQATRRTSASRQCGEGSRRGELTSCRIKPPDGRQQAGSAARDSGGGSSHPVGSSRQADFSKPGARRGIRKGGTHPLSDKATRRTSASRERGEGSGRGDLTGCRIKPRGGRQQAGSAARDPKGGISQAVGSSRQVDISKPAARREIREGELTTCRIEPPDGRKQVGSAARDP